MKLLLWRDLDRGSVAQRRAVPLVSTRRTDVIIDERALVLPTNDERLEGRTGGQMALGKTDLLKQCQCGQLMTRTARKLGPSSSSL
eukprot:SAG11_NODE_15287_length_583_cov_0.778926_1_plen_86_part_00